MSGARGEGAIINRQARTVRLRHEGKGFYYELRGDADTLTVVRVDEQTGVEETYGTLHLVRGKWRGEGFTAKKGDAVALVARAWNYVRLLKAGARNEP